MTKKSYAVFDLDGTVYRGNLTWDFYEALSSSGIIDGDSNAELDRLFSAHVGREHERAYEKYDHKMIEVFCDETQKLTELSTYRAIGEKVALENINKLYRFTRDEMKRLKDEGKVLIAISNAVSAVGEPFARALGFDITITNSEIIDSDVGRIAGWHIETRGPSKGKILESLVEKHNLTSLGSVGYGDTMGDIDMLRLVERPIVFNPEETLYDIALQENWEIIVERKNVIYNLRKHM